MFQNTENAETPGHAVCPGSAGDLRVCACLAACLVLFCFVFLKVYHSEAFLLKDFQKAAVGLRSALVTYRDWIQQTERPPRGPAWQVTINEHGLGRRGSSESGDRLKEPLQKTSISFKR